MCANKILVKNLKDWIEIGDWESEDVSVVLKNAHARAHTHTLHYTTHTYIHTRAHAHTHIHTYIHSYQKGTDHSKDLKDNIIIDLKGQV
jgi:hypothetical protein